MAKKVVRRLKKSKQEERHPGKSRGEVVLAEEPKAEPTLKRKEYRTLLAELQCRLFKLQEWAAAEGRRLVIVLEGVGPSGKRGTANRIAEGLDRRVCKVVSLDTTGKRERGQWHFQRFVEHFPLPGHIVVFDGSWYHVPAIERALGLSSDAEYAACMESCNEFEQILCHSGITLIKYWLTADDEEQEERFRSHMAEASKQTKERWAGQPITAEPAPLASVRELTFQKTDTPAAAWYLMRGNDRRQLRLDCIRHLLSLVPGEEMLLAVEPQSAAQAQVAE